HVRFIPEDQVDPESLAHHVRQGHTVVYFPEPLSPFAGRFRKISVAFEVSCPRAVLAVQGTGPWPLSRRTFSGKRHWFSPVRLSAVPLDPDGGHDAWTLQDGLGRAMMASQTLDTTLWNALLGAAQHHGRRKVVLEDENGQRLNYGQLIFKAILLGRLLEPQTRTGERVGLMLPTTVGTVVTFFAFQAGGRVPTMLNFSNGPETILATCRTAQVRLLVTSRLFIQKARLFDLMDALAELNIVYLEDLRSSVTPGILLYAWWFSHVTRWGRKPVSGDAEAVVLFTSGSEGIPKGVVLSHNNLLANAKQVFIRFDLGPADVILHVLPMFHAFGLTVATLVPLLAGMRIFCYPSVLDYRTVPKMAWKAGATLLAGTDTFLKGYGRMADPIDFAALRYCFAGAETLRASTRNLWMEKFGIRILEGYGATETAPVLSVNAPEAYRCGCVGRMLSGIEWKLQPVSGLKNGGRLFVRGPNVMLGYLLSHAPGVLQSLWTGIDPGWYDTGDVVQVDTHGFVSILGRVKRFAKIAGEMVSLAAVESVAMEEWPDSLHAAVVVADPQRGETLVMVTEDRKVNRLTFAKALKERGLSLLLLPFRFVYHDSLPVLASGKLDFIQLEIFVREGKNNMDTTDS
ncbi:MAG TPA: AMP-binding protein, partial [Magnetococcales bacterium]|nr:AMP-binding protein [Magnetococcales bacterium]